MKEGGDAIMSHYAWFKEKGDSIMKRLYRSRMDKKVAGVCGGLGEYFDVDPTVIRLVTVVLFFASGFFPILIGYIIAMIIVPVEPFPVPPADTKPVE